MKMIISTVIWTNLMCLNITIDVPQPYNLIGDGPEGPEVFVMTEKLRKRCGHWLHWVKALHPRYQEHGKNAIPDAFLHSLPLVIKKVYSKGKKTVVEFEQRNGDLWQWNLLISYGMSGHWQKEKCQYSQLQFHLQKAYYWTSTRSLPTCVVQFLNTDELQAELCKLGLDIINDEGDWDTVQAVYGKSKQGICAFLMDQKNFAGIGNYIKSVVLYRCGISPHRKVNELSEEKRWDIWETAKIVANEAIAAEGMGIRDYRNEAGEIVGVNFDITPYNMKHDAAGEEVTCEQIAGRTTWWVRSIQI